MPNPNTPAPATSAPAAPAPAAPAPAAEDQNFEDAFAAAVADPAEPPAAAPAPAPAASAPAPAPAEPPAPPAPAPAASAPASAPAESPAPAPAAPASAPAQPTVEELQAEIDRLRARAEAPASAPAASAPAPAPAATPAPPPPLYNEKETEALAKYQQEWPDVFAGEQLVRRNEYQQLVGYMFKQFVAPLQEEIAALKEIASTSFSRTQYGAIKSLVGDHYDEMYDDVLAWVDKQPAYLKTAYEEVTASGTPEDIADLCKRFVKETGWVSKKAVGAPAAAPAPAASAPAPAAPAPAVDPAIAAAAAALRPVSTARSSPTTGSDPNDFAGAFAEATATS